MGETTLVETPLNSLEPDWLADAKRITELYERPALGRPSVLGSDIHRINQLLKLVAHGNYVGTAFLAAGFSRQHQANWREAAKQNNVAAIALFDAIEKAEAWAEQDAVSDVAKAGKAGPQFWAASATRLERRHPERWGKRAEDGQTPRVVVQIGVQSGDVQVAFAPTSSGRPLLTGSE
jgi:hypothetical protein